MTSAKRTFAFALCAMAAADAAAAGIERIWLTYQTDTPRALVINWETDELADSRVEFGPTTALGQSAASEGRVRLHHVEIPRAANGGELHYRVRSGTQASEVFHVAPAPADELRVAVVADTGYFKSPWVEAVLREKPHLLLSAGDHIPALHSGTPVAPGTTTAFSKLIEHAPALFRTTPWLAALGNHDREMRPRGPKPPPDPVYDVEATAFREFLALPGDEWHWHFDIPAFGVRFVALDLSHLSDQGTTWQTCHTFKRDGVQFGWYRDLLAGSRQPFVVTLYNERNSQVRSLEGGEWGRMIAQGSLAITGFGYFAERSEVDGFTYYNTSISGTGARYPDPKSALLKSEDNFLLLTLHHDPATLRVEIKNLSGETLDRKDFAPRQASR